MKGHPREDRNAPRARLAAAALLVASALVGAACGGGRRSPTPAPTAAPAPVPVVHSNTIRWATASEDENFGYDVFRGDSPDGPFVRLNETTIEGAGTTDETRSYQFVDDTIDPYRTYYYYVESISLSGDRQRFTPVGKAGPKLPVEPPPPEESDG